MTLFESEIRKLNIPKCVMDDIVSLRNICLEAEQQPQPQQQPKPQAAQPAQPQNQAANPQQTAPQAQPQQNTQQQAPQQGQTQEQQTPKNNEQQAQPQNQQATQQQGNQQQGNQQTPENITENQVDDNKLMALFNKFIAKCQSDVKARLIKDFGEENVNKFMPEVESAAQVNGTINFDREILPWLSKDGKHPEQNVIDGVRQRLQKYFGVKFAEPKKAQEDKTEQKQEQTESNGGQQGTETKK